MKLTLRACRHNKGLTLVEASQRLGVSRDTLRNWEIGKTYPDVKNLIGLMELYDVSYDDIFFDFK